MSARRLGGSGCAVVGVFRWVGVFVVGIAVGINIDDCTTVPGDEDAVGMVGRRIDEDAVGVTVQRC